MNNMEEVIDEVLFDKRLARKLINKENKEKQDDVKDILEAEEDEDESKSDEEATDDAASDDAEDATAKESRKTANKRKPKGEKVLEVGLLIDGVDQGTIEIGSEEYGTITDMSALLDLFDIAASNLTDPEKTVKSFVLSTKESVSQSGENTISIMMQSNKDETFSINVLVNEIGQTFSDLVKAVEYFDTQYQQNVLDTINREVR